MAHKRLDIPLQERSVNNPSQLPLIPTSLVQNGSQHFRCQLHLSSCSFRYRIATRSCACNSIRFQRRQLIDLPLSEQPQCHRRCQSHWCDPFGSNVRNGRSGGLQSHWGNTSAKSFLDGSQNRFRTGSVLQCICRTSPPNPTLSYRGWSYSCCRKHWRAHLSSSAFE